MIATLKSGPLTVDLQGPRTDGKPAACRDTQPHPRAVVRATTLWWEALSLRYARRATGARRSEDARDARARGGEAVGRRGAGRAPGRRRRRRLGQLPRCAAAPRPGAGPGDLDRRPHQGLAPVRSALVRQSLHDSLTGLPNRALYLERLRDAIRGAEETSGTPAALLLDLDGFKAVNDTLGHGAGDELLQRIADRLRRVRDVRTVARLGGDEFASAGRLRRRRDRAGPAARRVARADPGAGVTSAPASASPSRADGPDDCSPTPISRCTRQGRRRRPYEVFARPCATTCTPGWIRRPAPGGRPRRDRGLLPAGHRLRAGRHRPEALARWRHPEGGLIPPGVFIPSRRSPG